jgi:hypothetical protein
MINSFYDDVAIIGIAEMAEAVSYNEGIRVFDLRKILGRREEYEKGSLLRSLKGKYNNLPTTDLLTQPTDILILAEGQRKLTDEQIENINAAVVMEVVPSILSLNQIRRLGQRGIFYISSLWLGLSVLYVAREERLHSLVPREREHVNDMRVHVSTGMEGLASALIFEELERSKTGSEASIHLKAWETGRDMARNIQLQRLKLWGALTELIKVKGLKLPALAEAKTSWQVSVARLNMPEELHSQLQPVLERVHS